VPTGQERNAIPRPLTDDEGLVARREELICREACRRSLQFLKGNNVRLGSLEPIKQQV